MMMSFIVERYRRIRKIPDLKAVITQTVIPMAFTAPASADDLASSEDGESEVSESDHGDADDSQESSAEIPLYERSTLTSASFDALLLAFFKKHRTS